MKLQKQNCGGNMEHKKYEDGKVKDGMKQLQFDIIICGKDLGRWGKEMLPRERSDRIASKEWKGNKLSRNSP